MSQDTSSDSTGSVSTFLNELPQIEFKLGHFGTDAENNFNAVLNGKSGDGFFNSYNAQKTLGYDPNNPNNTAWTTFFNNLSAYTGGDVTQSENGFYQEYKAALQASIDFSSINPPPTDSELNAQCQSAFNAFIANYPYGSGNVTQREFFNNWETFLTSTAFVKTTTSQQATGMGFGDVLLPSYQQIFEGYFGSAATSSAFSTLLTQFYKDELKKTSPDGKSEANGYFIPSQALADWYKKVQASFSNATTGTDGLTSTSVTTPATKKVIVLDKVFLLLVDMIGSIQRVAAAQANRLNFYSQWQRAYTDEQNQVHYFVEGSDRTGDDKIGGTTGPSRRGRDALNQQNQIYIQNIQGNQSIVSDDAKALQSNVNQSNDAANQQSSLANSIIQQLSTLVSSIFK